MPTPSGTFSDVTLSDEHSCGLRTDGTVTCWGGRFDDTNQPTGTFKQISAGGYEAGGIRPDGSIEGFSPAGGAYTGRAGTFRQFAVGFGYSCALALTGTVTCFSWGTEEEVTIVGTFAQISAGFHIGCGLRSDGTLACWSCDGPDGSTCEPCSADRSDLPSCNEWTTPPAGQFAQLSKGALGSCAVTKKGAVRCWGDSSLTSLMPAEVTDSDCQ